MSTLRSRAISSSTGAVKAPSASPVLPWMSFAASPLPRLMPKLKLRDCGLEQVRIRSPRPDRPIIVSVLAPSARPKRTSSAKPRVVSAAAALAPSPRPVTMPDGDRQHVLGRAADLDAAHVGRLIGPEGARRQRLGQLRRQRLVMRRERHRGRQAARHVGGKARPGQDRRRRVRRAFGDHLGHELVGAVLDALGAGDDRRARRDRCRQRLDAPSASPAPAPPAGSPRARAASREIARHRDAVLDPHAGQESALALLRELLGVRRVMLPQRDLASGPRGDVGERGAPCAAAEHRDAIECHAATRACCDISARLRLRPGDLFQRPARARREVERIGQAQRQPLGAGPGDHRAVVGAKLAPAAPRA